MQYYFEFHYCSNSRVETKRCHVDNGSSKYSVLQYQFKYLTYKVALDRLYCPILCVNLVPHKNTFSLPCLFLLNCVHHVNEILGIMYFTFMIVLVRKAVFDMLTFFT